MGCRAKIRRVCEPFMASTGPEASEKVANSDLSHPPKKNPCELGGKYLKFVRLRQRSTN